MKRVVCAVLALCLLCGVLFSCRAQTYTVTFETNGGSAVNAIALEEGATLAAPATPTKAGYVFGGWYADEGLLDAYVFGKMPAKSFTLYAKWTPESDNGNENGDNENGGTVIGGERGEDGSWDNVDFGGQTVKIALSVNSDTDCSFPAADIYIKGPDKAGSNEVAKEVLARNAQAEQALGITIEYVEKDLAYSDVQQDIRMIAMTSAKSSPDIYNNDMYGLSRAMVDGLLWNLNDPGEDIANYFDFEAEGFYTEYMKGLTFDQEKVYLFAGDYFIDMIRMAWVVLVNNDLFAMNARKMPSWCDSVDDFYSYVEYGYWDMDALAEISLRVFTEGLSGQLGVTEKTDTLVGFAYNGESHRIFSAASGVTLYYQDDDYSPSVLQDIGDYQKVANKFANLTGSYGVYYREKVNSSTECFLQGNFLFAMSRLGEMESYAMRDFSASKGIVPVPKWDAKGQDDYHTVVDEHAEIGCILNTAHAYSAASALMQYLNEESDGVISTYYEKGLKYKYNDDENAREMMDLVVDSIGSPFGYNIGALCENLYTGVVTLSGISITKPGTLASTFACERDAYIDCMQRMVAKFENFD